MREDRLKVLEMLAAGKINVEEAYSKHFGSAFGKGGSKSAASR